jgi:hypothetical protein
MNPDLAKLVHLHQAETELRRLDSDLADLPRLRAELNERLDRDRGRLETARQNLEASQEERRQHEAEVLDLEAKRSKYKGQLMDVKTNKEYTAMLHEIETVEREIRGREDKILEEMERAETLSEEVAREEVAFRSVEQSARVDAAALDDRQTRLEAERQRVGGERDALADAVPQRILQLYQRVSRLRGTGMSEARDGMCQTCHVKLRPQMWVEVRLNEAVVQCAACNRILYYEPPPPTVVAEP